MYSPTKKDLIDQTNTRIGKNPKKIVVYGKRIIKDYNLNKIKHS
jgi:hypothetical protein